MSLRFRAPALLTLGLMTAAFIPTAAQAATAMTASDATTNYGDPVTLSARFLATNDGCGTAFCPVRRAQIDFSVDSGYVGSALTDDGGIARLLIVPSQNLHVGTHAILASYDVYSNPASSITATARLTITKEITAVTAHKGYFEAQLTDDENMPLSGQAVRFHVATPNGEQDVCTAFSDATGTARCVATTGAGLSQLGVVQTSYTATFDGTGDYVAASGSATLV